MRIISNASSNYSNYTDRVVKPQIRTDQRLLELVSDGDDQAFAELYERHSTALFNYLIRLLNEKAVAEDVLQEAFLAIWDGAEGFNNHSTVRTWLFQIAHNQAVSWLRNHKAEMANKAGDDYSWSDESPETRSIVSWRNEKVHQAINQLRPIHRSVIVLAFVHGLAYSEISEVLNCPLGTVKSRMSYALRYLDPLLRNQDLGR